METITVKAIIRSTLVKSSGALTRITDDWQVSYTRHQDDRIELHSIVPAAIGRFDVIHGIDSWSKTGIIIEIKKKLGMNTDCAFKNLVNGNRDGIK